ncbi:MAG TPA: hypothetical protein VGM47_06425 [Gammaproteobacteria bacterium]|jgi:hypothetical protein
MADEDKDNGRRGLWGGIAMGLVVVAVGLVFLLRNLGIPLPFVGLHNWWALFILVGAVPLLAQAAESYRKAGRVDQKTLHALLSAASILLVAAFFLLDLDWAVWWPLFVIYGGLRMLAGVGKKRAS